MRAVRALRHDRYLHSWGIADGLELVGTPRTDTAGPYVEVTVSPGLAIDGSGREIVVTESIRVSEDAFDQLNITDSANDPTQHFYPVFIVGRDEQASAAARRTSVCLENPSTRVSESLLHHLRKPGLRGGSRPAGRRRIRMPRWAVGRHRGASCSDS